MVCGDDGRDDAQAQADSALASGPGYVRAVEPVEDARRLTGREARPIVGDLQDAAIGLDAHSQFDVTVSGRVRDGVADEIA